jgi:hypothetical protein
MFCSETLQRWRDSGYDAVTGVNTPYNLPKPLSPHQHENGYDSRCGLCQHLAELSRSR